MGVADVVGRDHKRPCPGQILGTSDAQPEQPAHDQPIECIERHAECGREHAGRREPTCEIRRHGPFTRQRTGFVAALDRQAEQVANRLDAGDTRSEAELHLATSRNDAIAVPAGGLSLQK